MAGVDGTKKQWQINQQRGIIRKACCVLEYLRIKGRDAELETGTRKTCAYPQVPSSIQLLDYSKGLAWCPGGARARPPMTHPRGGQNKWQSSLTI
jgi:hypothetical protein